jgi:adenylate kinase
MRLLIMGPPGAGKGTQAVLIQKHFDIPHVSTGDLFREAVKNNSPLGVSVRKYIEHGELVPDDITIQVVIDRLKHDDCKNGFLFDGFPRTIPQAVALDSILSNLNITLDAVINVVVSNQKLMERIAGRRVCKVCNAGYHVVTNKPKVEGVCDKCGGELYQRKDDTAETVQNRLKVYNDQTKPLLDYYDKRNIIKNVNGLGEIQDTFKEVLASLGVKQ